MDRFQPNRPAATNNNHPDSTAQQAEPQQEETIKISGKELHVSPDKIGLGKKVRTLKDPVKYLKMTSDNESVNGIDEAEQFSPEKKG